MKKKEDSQTWYTNLYSKSSLGVTNSSLNNWQKGICSYNIIPTKNTMQDKRALFFQRK